MIKQWYCKNTNSLQSNPPWYPMKIVNQALKQQYLEQGWIEVDSDFILPQPELTEEELLNRIRQERDKRINETIWIFQRQMTGTPEQKLPEEKYQEWIDYWAILRDIPEVCDLQNFVWPIEPI
jgi:hypothetical protein